MIRGPLRSLYEAAPSPTHALSMCLSGYRWEVLQVNKLTSLPDLLAELCERKRLLQNGFFSFSLAIVARRSQCQILLVSTRKRLE
jgi:hypothetical protein